VDKAALQFRDKACLQPLLFAFQGRLWIKLHNTAVTVHASCIADAFELMLQYFFTLNARSPSELWLVYGLFERVIGLKPTVGRSVTLEEFTKHEREHREQKSTVCRCATWHV